MKKINFYLFTLASKYILINLIIITIFVLFLNLLEISRILEKENTTLGFFLLLSLLKLPTIISEIIPFVVILSIAFLFKNLITNNELISIRNMGFSILDIFKPIAIAIFLFGLFILLFINPLAANFENNFNNLTSKKYPNMYSIKFINEGMWIKNISEDNNINYINISKINLDNMNAEEIKILNINNKFNKIIIAEKGEIIDKIFKLQNVSIFNINNDKFEKVEFYNLILNFDKSNIIDSILNFKFIPFYKYKKHVNNLKKFNLHSSEVSLYYLSEILKPIFLVIIGFTVMGFSGKFKRNESFFKVLFISILIGFLIFLLKEIVTTLTTTMKISFIFSYFIIFMFPLMIGLYQMIRIESD
ncbi:MAG: LptF/LptG family permease [Alphaproteobacteria bacterium]|nr:LptF/LptG family permease [Alphaproteobacteria bacterium]